MVHSPAPPPLQAKPRGGAGAGQVAAAAAPPPPPLKIKIVPAPVQTDVSAPIIVTTPDVTATGAEESTAIMAALSPSATEETAEEGVSPEVLSTLNGTKNDLKLK